ncbi:hypothetical protein ACP4OV_013960 [Aristida adscensionis]
MGPPVSVSTGCLIIRSPGPASLRPPGRSTPATRNGIFSRRRRRRRRRRLPIGVGLARTGGPLGLGFALLLLVRNPSWPASCGLPGISGVEAESPCRRRARCAPAAARWGREAGAMGEYAAQGSGLWKQIDDAEYIMEIMDMGHLVSGSFEQAISTALSASDQIRVDASENSHDDGELLEILESAGMVLVQALKELRRTSEMFVQLKTMFGSVASVPVKVFLTGATMQMAAGPVSDLRSIFEEYLAKWRYTNNQVYVFNGGQDSSWNGFPVTSVMSAEQYLELAELYAVTFLSIVSQESETAVSWVEKAELSEEDHQELLKKLRALQSAANEKSSPVKGLKQTVERNLSTPTNVSKPSINGDAPNTVPVYEGVKKDPVKSTQPSIQRVPNQFDPLFWWFHSVRLKFGNIHIVLPSGKLMLLFSLLFSTIYMLRRKTSGLKRTVFQHASSLRRAFVDALQLAFSVQMNPLAAVQQVPQAPRGSW